MVVDGFAGAIYHGHRGIGIFGGSLPLHYSAAAGKKRIHSLQEAAFHHVVCIQDECDIIGGGANLPQGFIQRLSLGAALESYLDEQDGHFLQGGERVGLQAISDDDDGITLGRIILRQRLPRYFEDDGILPISRDEDRNRSPHICSLPRWFAEKMPRQGE